MSNASRVLLFTVFVFSLLLIREVGSSLGAHHIQPYIALFFTLAALRKWQWLSIPFVGYLGSSILASGGLASWMVPSLLAFAAIALVGSRFSPKSQTSRLLGGSLIGAGVFYLITNIASWLSSPAYAKSLSGLAQALWLGEPGYAPTWTFFRNDALATLAFTGIILVINRLTFGEKPTLVPTPAEA